MYLSTVKALINKLNFVTLAYKVSIPKYRLQYFWILFITVFTIHNVNAQNEIVNDPLLNKFQRYITYDHIDSAQLLIYKIQVEQLGKNRGPLFNYYVQQTQLEVYFFSGLLEFGIKAGYDVLKIANDLKDSLCIATTSEYMGLQYQEMGDYKKADSFFVLGATLFPKNPNYNTHRNKFGVANILQSLAESRLLKAEYTDALKFNAGALAAAPNSADIKITTIIWFTYADIYAGMQNTDSALWFYQKSLNTAQQGNFYDMMLYNYAGLANLYAKLGNISKANENIDLGYQLTKKGLPISIYYLQQFFKKVIPVLDLLGNEPKQIVFLKKYQALQAEKNSKSNALVQKIMTSFKENENLLVNMKLAETNYSKERLQYLNVLLVVLMLGIAGWVFYYRSKLKKNTEALKLRNKISQDLHDDIGASLSSLQIYSTVAQNTFKNDPTKAEEMLQKITTQSKLVMENMNDIVWSMNIGGTKTISLEAKIKDYSSELLSNCGITFKYNISKLVELNLQDITVKRNLLLIIKEALNNISKYSQATEASLNASINNKILYVNIIDNGVGFDFIQRKAGNGINNMQKRVFGLNGSFNLVSKFDSGTNISLTIPVSKGLQF